MKSNLHILAIIIIVVLVSSCAEKPVVPDGEWIKVADGLNFPEGPTWDGQSALYVSNCYGDWITRYRNAVVDTFLQHTEETAEFERSNGLLFHGGFLYACDFGTNSILKIDSDKGIRVLSKGTTERPFKRPNDLAMGPDGFLYVTDPFHYDRQNPDGAVYKIDPESGTTEIVITNLAFPNGIAFSPDSRSLYICESAFNRVLKYSFQIGEITPGKCVFIELPGGDPDGIAFDRKGNLYVAHFGGGAVYIVSPSGDIIATMKTPGKKPTNLEFGDRNLKTLYLTEVETNSLYKHRMSIAGVKLY